MLTWIWTKKCRATWTVAAVGEVFNLFIGF